MDASLLKELIGKGKPVRIETASGQAYEIRHQDFVSFSPKRTSLFISFEENDGEHFAVVPLLTVTAADYSLRGPHGRGYNFGKSTLNKTMTKTDRGLHRRLLLG